MVYAVLKIKPRASYMVGKHSTELHPRFVKIFYNYLLGRNEKSKTWVSGQVRKPGRPVMLPHHHPKLRNPGSHLSSGVLQLLPEGQQGRGLGKARGPPLAVACTSVSRRGHGPDAHLKL